MKKLLLLTSILSIFTYCGPDAKTKELMSKAKSTFGAMPDKMPGAENDSAELVALGKKLYFEKRLSKNDTQSCNSCHEVGGKGGGVDNQPTSTGAFGDKGGRNAPTVLNAGFQLAQFWDGRAKDLVAQAKGPILNPIEMAMPSEKAAVDKITAIAEYQEMFKKAGIEINYQNIAEAIAAFERTLVTKDRLNDFISGKAGALSSDEKKGLDLFLTVGCTNCHNGTTIGGNSYRKIGEKNAYITADMVRYADKGRFEVTKNEADKYVFKVPMLRNIALTGPYFHDGSVKTLDDAVKKMAWHQLNKQLKEEEIGYIVKFLHSLTDKSRE